MSCANMFACRSLSCCATDKRSTGGCRALSAASATAASVRAFLASSAAAAALSASCRFAVGARLARPRHPRRRKRLALRRPSGRVHVLACQHTRRAGDGRSAWALASSSDEESSSSFFKRRTAGGAAGCAPGMAPSDVAELRFETARLQTASATARLVLGRLLGVTMHSVSASPTPSRAYGSGPTSKQCRCGHGGLGGPRHRAPAARARRAWLGGDAAHHPRAPAAGAAAAADADRHRPCCGLGGLELRLGGLELELE